MYMGIPAKPVRELTEQEIAFFKYSAHHYVKLMQAYQADAKAE
jgi:carbonic anhydrase/acetyltransferase-like protein (isoleucine patch superfamily)